MAHAAACHNQCYKVQILNISLQTVILYANMRLNQINGNFLKVDYIIKH